MNPLLRQTAIGTTTEDSASGTAVAVPNCPLISR